MTRSPAAGATPGAPSTREAAPSRVPPAPFTESAIETPAGRKCVLVASTVAARQRGLMGFHATAPWDGMLFTFEGLSTAPFYMKDTLIPLDIAFLAPDGAVQEVLAMEPCPDGLQECPRYHPSRPYARALEVERGKAAAFGIAAGARVVPAGPC